MAELYGRTGMDWMFAGKLMSIHVYTCVYNIIYTCIYIHMHTCMSASVATHETVYCTHTYIYIVICATKGYIHSLKRGHPCNQDIFLCLSGVLVVSLYTCTYMYMYTNA